MHIPSIFSTLALLSSASAILPSLPLDEPLSICDTVFPGSYDVCCDEIYGSSRALCSGMTRVSNLTDCGGSSGVRLTGWSCCSDSECLLRVGRYKASADGF